MSISCYSPVYNAFKTSCMDLNGQRVKEKNYWKIAWKKNKRLCHSNKFFYAYEKYWGISFLVFCFSSIFPFGILCISFRLVCIWRDWMHLCLLLTSIYIWKEIMDRHSSIQDTFVLHSLSSIGITFMLPELLSTLVCCLSFIGWNRRM